MEKYDHKKIEAKWKKKWAEDDLYKVSDKQDKPKYYILDMFPYPSGAGLHVGHPKGYIATDVFARLKMLQGYNVLHPMGWDAFGLPAENYALKNKTHPRVATEKNVETYKRQLEMLGFSYDWSREINTTDPEFYKWTQWTFIKMFERGLAYESYEPINWCPSCKTGLANEDLEDGKCERCGSDIEQKPMRQWVLKITDYADRLLNDLAKLPEWEESIKEMQRNWIGRSEGAEVDFQIDGEKVTVFTTRPDTLFGATFFVLAPEHPLVEKITTDNQKKEVEKYIKNTAKKTEMERTELAKEKTGVFTGAYAINPVNNEKIPVWIADYVMMGYGTGAIMAVPAHDERDWEFAKKYNIAIKDVVAPFYPAHNTNWNVREEVVMVKRKIVCCIIKHWKENKYLLSKRLDLENYYSFIVGGAEDGENLIDAAKREILEETGYKNFKIVEQINGEAHTKFFASHKNENRHGIFYGFIFELENGDQDTISEEERSKHEIEWVEPGKIKDLVKFGNQYMFFDKLFGKKAFSGKGINVNSDFLNDLATDEAKEKMISWLEEKKLGKRAVNYKLKDWVFSRQRYWGEPIPIVHCAKCGAAALPENELPLKLPEVENYEPTGTGESPLANISEWVNATCPKCGGPAKRETNTMPQWAGSSWYYLRYIDPKNDKALVDKDKEKYWSPVDFYVGGAEHATRHLIYARFWHKFLFDIGAVSYDEPFKRLQHVGLILAEDGRKMSKRWGNVINPDEIVEKYGADAMRVYEMFMGPFSQAVAWSTNGLVGTRKFLEKVIRIKSKVNPPATAPAQIASQFEADGSHERAGSQKSKLQIKNQNLERLLHKTIKKVTEDIEGFKFNTAVSQMMILVNEMEKEEEVSIIHYSLFIILLSPFAPHIAEEIWSELGHKESIFKESWPEYDPALARDEKIELVLQVNGKLRDTIEVDADIDEDEAKKMALGNEKIKKWLEGKEMVKVVVVKGKLVNIVVKG